MVNTEIEDWRDRAIGNGGAPSMSTLGFFDAFYTRLKNAGIASKLLRLNLIAGNNMACVACPVIKLIGNELDSFTAPDQSSYVETGEGGGVTHNFLFKLDTGITSDLLEPNNVSIGVYRTGDQENTNNGANAYGTNDGYQNLGIIRSGFYGYRTSDFRCGDTGYADAGYWMNYNGFIVGSGNLDGTKYYRNGIIRGVGRTAPTGVFNTNTLKFPQGINGTLCAYFVATSLTDEEVADFYSAIQILQTQLDREVEEHNNHIYFLGDSLTYGLGDNYYTVANPYPEQLRTISDWDIEHYDVYKNGTSGRTGEDMASKTYEFLDVYNPQAPSNLLIVWTLTNDIMNNLKTASQALVYLDSICQDARERGYKVLILTLPPANTYATGAGKINWDIQAPLVNDELMTNPHYSNGVKAHGVVPIHQIPELADAEDETVSRDGLHFTDLGYTYIAEAVAPFAEAVLALETLPPLIPLNLRANGQNEEIVVEWDPSTDEGDEGGTVAYSLTRDGAEIYNGALYTFTDTGRTNGVKHLYRIRSIDEQNNTSAYSDPVECFATILTASDKEYIESMRLRPIIG